MSSVLVDGDQGALLAVEIVVVVVPLERGGVFVVGGDFGGDGESADEAEVGQEAADGVVGVVEIGQPKLEGHGVEDGGGVVALQCSDLLGQHMGTPDSMYR